MTHLKKCLAHLKREDGGATIEFVLWVPVLAAIVLLAADMSMIYLRQSNMWQVSRDTVRIVSRYGMDEAAAETWAKAQITMASYTPAVDVTIAGGLVSIEMSADLDEIAPFGWLNFALDSQLKTTVTHAMEPI